MIPRPFLDLDTDDPEVYETIAWDLPGIRRRRKPFAQPADPTPRTLPPPSFL